MLSMLPFKGPLSNQIVEAVSNQMKYNFNLIHIDLSHTDLKKDEALVIADAMR